MKNRTALVFGATGLVGRHLVEELIRNMRYTSVKVFTRRALNIEHIKLLEYVVDVEDVSSYSDQIRGDDLFIAIGTTLRKAGSVAREEETDRHLVVEIAAEAQRRGAGRIAVVSSLGADAGARNFYRRIKGQMEKDIQNLKFQRIVIARPSLLLGKREDFRLFEEIAKVLARGLGFIFKGKLAIYRAIHARTVAYAMVYLIGTEENKSVYLSDELQKFGREETEQIN